MYVQRCWEFELSDCFLVYWCFIAAAAHECCLYVSRQNEVREALLSLKQIPAVAFNVCESLQCAKTNLSSSLPQITDYENICTLIEQHCVCVNTDLYDDDVL